VTSLKLAKFSVTECTAGCSWPSCIIRVHIWQEGQSLVRESGKVRCIRCKSYFCFFFSILYTALSQIITTQQITSSRKPHHIEEFNSSQVSKLTKSTRHNQGSQLVTRSKIDKVNSSQKIDWRVDRVMWPLPIVHTVSRQSVELSLNMHFYKFSFYDLDVFIWFFSWWRHERLASARHYAYDVIEIRAPNKKNFKFGLWASYKPTPIP